MTTDRDKRLSDLRQTLFTYLYDMHPSNQNVALWYGLVTNNVDIVDKSLSSGADPKLTDKEIIWSLRDTLLKSEMSHTLIEWFHITRPITDRDKRLSDLRKTLFTYLYDMHPSNHNVALWYGTVTGNVDIVKKSLSSGADPNVKDTEVIWPLRDTLLHSEIADTFIEWLLEMDLLLLPKIMDEIKDEIND
jgi:predicted transcriptional regulator with HTH domain